MFGLLHEFTVTTRPHLPIASFEPALCFCRIWSGTADCCGIPTCLRFGMSGMDYCSLHPHTYHRALVVGIWCTSYSTSRARLSGRTPCPWIDRIDGEDECQGIICIVKILPFSSCFRSLDRRAKSLIEVLVTILECLFAENHLKCLELLDLKSASISERVWLHQ